MQHLVVTGQFDPGWLPAGQQNVILNTANNG